MAASVAQTRPGASVLWRGARVFDGTGWHGGPVAAQGGRIVEPGARADRVIDLAGGYLVPGFIDLQVNGGGGALLGAGDPARDLATICTAHARLGATGVMPTLISDLPQVTRAVIEAAARLNHPGFLGLHLEGPHLDPRRAGAHDPALIRPMTDADLALYLDAARRLPALMITLAPEGARPDQIAALAGAGVLVSLGHSDCTEAAARAAMAAGARCVTHLFNAMSGLGHRAPGLAGAALDSAARVGIIADGVHVTRSAFRIAAAAAGERLFVVSDAMAVAGTDLPGFALNGRAIRRAEGRLTLADGTLAGADVTPVQALRWMVQDADLPLEQALALLTLAPARTLSLPDRGHLHPGARADLVHLTEDLTLAGVWQDGICRFADRAD